MTEIQNDHTDELHDLYIAGFEYQWPKEKHQRPFSIYWVLMTDNPADPEGLEYFVGDERIIISQPLTITRIGRIKDIKNFQEIVEKVELIERGVPYAFEEVMRHYKDEPYDDGQPGSSKSYTNSELLLGSVYSRRPN